MVKFLPRLSTIVNKGGKNFTKNVRTGGDILGVLGGKYILSSPVEDSPRLLCYVLLCETAVSVIRRSDQFYMKT